MPNVLFIVVAINLIGLLPSLVSSSASAWVVHSEIMQFLCAFFCIGWACEVPYDNPVKKSVLAIQGAIELSHLVYLLPMFAGHTKVSIVAVYLTGVLAGCAFASRVAFRWYSRPSEELDKTGLYEIWSRPQGVMSLVTSWFAPGGGKSIYANNKWYHFHHGKVRVYPRAVLKRRIKQGAFFAIRRRDCKVSDVQKLENLVGAKWSWVHNCLYIFNKKEF